MELNKSETTYKQEGRLISLKTPLKEKPPAEAGVSRSLVVANPDLLRPPRRVRPAPATVVVVAVAGEPRCADEEEAGIAMMMSVMHSLAPAADRATHTRTH